MVDLKPGLVGTDPRFFLDDGKGGWDPLQLPAAQPVTIGLDLSSRADMTATVTFDRDGDLTDWNGPSCSETGPDARWGCSRTTSRRAIGRRCPSLDT